MSNLSSTAGCDRHHFDSSAGGRTHPAAKSQQGGSPMATADNGNGTPGYLVFDTESVPDGRLLALVKYAGDGIGPEEAVRRAQTEARERSFSGSDFLPVSFQVPVATCVLRVGGDFRLQGLTCLDAPEFRPRKIVEAFWSGVASYRAKYAERIK